MAITAQYRQSHGDLVNQRPVQIFKSFTIHDLSIQFFVNHLSTISGICHRTKLSRNCVRKMSSNLSGNRL